MFPNGALVQLGLILQARRAGIGQVPLRDLPIQCVRVGATSKPRVYLWDTTGGPA